MPPNLLQDTDWAYLAGFADGEGCIRATKQKVQGKLKYYPRLHIGQTDQVVLLELYELFEVGRFRLREWNKKYSNGQVSAIWDISKGEELRWLLTNLVPYLRLKKAQAEVALRLLDNKSNEAYVTELKQLKIHRQIEL